MEKMNCWEFKKCGRQPGGEKVKELGVCPVVVAVAADGIHEGRKGGRACWVVSGTFCGGKVQGTFAEKIGNCLNCEFYKTVKAEEGKHFLSLGSILNRIKEHIASKTTPA